MHWVPIFELYEVQYDKPAALNKYIPFFSDLSLSQLNDVVNAAKKHNKLRLLVESIVIYDPVLLDFLHNMDHTKSKKPTISNNETETDEKQFSQKLLLTSKQSYGRQIVKNFELEILRKYQSKKSCIIFPCSAKRPYNSSRKHRNIHKKLAERKVFVENYDLIVFTSLGIIPEPLWSNKVVMSYDARVPDIYRLLCLARKYFSLNSYQEVIDCTNFNPYHDILNILKQENKIEKVIRFSFSNRKHFHLNY